MRRSSTALAAALAGTLLFVGASCGAGDSGPELSAEGEKGREIAGTNGCAACHGNNGQGGAGPAWTGLFGSTVELDDGTSVVADEEYIRTSITDPGAQRNAGYTLQMPENSLTDDEIDSVIAYIRDLSPEAVGED
jgi:cytochrome c oxidase subunit 2